MNVLLSFADVEMEDFRLDLIALDRDILSLELPSFFRDYFLVRTDMDITCEMLYK